LKVNILCVILLGILAPLSKAVGQTTIFLPWDSNWNYYDSGNAPPSIGGQNWFSETYNDSSWASGDAELGFGDGDEETVINSSVNTAYFRKDFVINNVCQYEDIKLRIRHDDGSIVYLNGVEVWRINMPNGPISYSTYASSTSGDNSIRTITLPVSAFNGGTNTIAVETHQVNAGSTDISFNFTVFGNLDAQTYMCSCNGNTIKDSDGDGICDDIDLCDNSAGDCEIDLSQFSFCFSNVLASIPDDFSGITYNFDSRTFYSVENDASKVFELDLDGNIKRTVTLNGFDDVEGIVYLGNNEFIVIEERARRIVFINIPPGNSNITRSYPGSNNYIEVTGFGSGTNDGLEGVAYSTVDDILYIAKEKTTMRIFSIANPVSKKGSAFTPNQPFSLANEASGYPGNNGGFTDIAGLAFTDKGTLLMLSEQGSSLVEVDPFSGNLLSHLDLSFANNSDIEGVTFISDTEIVLASEPNEFYRYTIDGGSCDDGLACTSNDTWSGCDCVGTQQDSDGDGICDGDDSCPNLNNSLIGNSCNDGDPCTTNDVYTSACNCEGTFQDSDNDGICNAQDSCPNLNNALIGSSCNDGDPCTTNDVYTTASCGCAGTSAQDSDNDGVCDANDICPGFNDGIDSDNDGIPNGCDSCNGNLNGTACDDMDPQTTNDVFDAQCNCAGTLSGGQQVEICVNQDAYLQGNFKFNTSDLRVQPGSRVTYLKFDLSQVQGPIASAELRMKVGADFGDGTIKIDLGDSNNWFEGNLSITNKPNSVQTLGSRSGNFNVNQEYVWTLSGLTYQSTISLIVTQTSGNDVSFKSSENSDASACPTLILMTGPTCTTGASCDDGDICTTNDVYDANCDCAGTFQDSDNDGTCNANDSCPNDSNKTSPGLCGCGSIDSDSNNNGVCDADENDPNCAASLFIAGVPATNTVYEAKRFVTSNGTHPHIGVSIEFSAGEVVTLLPGFEVKKGALFHGYIEGCN